jgi:biopolymer transport protein ExbB/TolQ
MSIPSSHRPTREWMWLVFALILVGAIVVPAWMLTGSSQSQAEFFSKWTPERVAKLFLGPEQAACYICFAWAGLILFNRRREVARQRQAFHLELLPTDEGARILPEDARPLSRKVENVSTRSGPYILGNMIRLGLNKYAVSKAAPDVAEVVRNQAEVEQSRFVATMGTVNYLAWAIPAIGFLGTVRGLAGGMSLAGNTDTQLGTFVKQATDQLGIAFDCTFVALALSLILMYFLHAVQRSEETLLIDCQDYCQEHLLLRLYDPHPVDLVNERV